MNIILIGATGAGKGTHAKTLAANYHLAHVSCGDLFRKNLHEHTAIGLLAKKYVARGELVPDEVVDAMMEEWVRKIPFDQGVLIDGFPRTAGQVHFVDDLFSETGRQLDAVIYFRVPNDEVIQRLAGRLICRDCQTPYHRESRPPKKNHQCDACGGDVYHRPDDTARLIAVRLRSFYRTVEGVLRYYQELGQLFVVDGRGGLEDVGQRLNDLFGQLKQGLAQPAPVELLDEMVSRRRAALAKTEIQSTYPSANIVLLGGPGSGKGTQAVRLSQKLKLSHIATGDLFRDNLKHNTDLGKLAKSYMDKGELVPDDVTEAMVEERLSRSDIQDGFILDGFPRTLPQAEALTEILAEKRRKLTSALYINVSDQEIVKRLSGRLICRACQAPFHVIFSPPVKEGVCDRCGGELYQRADDNPSTIKARLQTFHRQTSPMLDYFRESGLLVEVNGEGGLNDVSSRTLKTLQTVMLEDDSGVLV